jgi:hypothetical protein
MTEPDPGVWRALLDHLWAPVVALVTWLAKGRIEKAEAKLETAVQRSEFDAFKTASIKDRDERRETELALFKRVDDLRTHVDAKFDALTTIILNTRKD